MWDKEHQSRSLLQQQRAEEGTGGISPAPATAKTLSQAQAFPHKQSSVSANQSWALIARLVPCSARRWQRHGLEGGSLPATPEAAPRCPGAGVETEEGGGRERPRSVCF